MNFFLISWIILSTAHWKWKFIAFSSSSQCNRYERSHQQHAGMSSVCLMFCGKVWKLMENPKSCFAANENLCLHSNAHNSTAKNQDFSEIKFSCLHATKRALWKSLKFNMWVYYLMKFTINTKSDLRIRLFYRRRKHESFFFHWISIISCDYTFLDI